MKLKGKRGLLISEPDSNSSIRTANVKLLLGGDSISARGLYERRATEFTINSGIDLLCNKKLNLDAQDGGVSRRVLDIYYDSKFVSDDHDIDPARNIYRKNRNYESDSWLDANAPVFLKLLIEIHFKYMQLNQVQYQKPVPRAIIERTEQWLRDSNPFLSYLNDNLEPCGCTVETIGRPKDGHAHGVLWKDIYEMFCRSQEYGALNKAEKRNLSQKHCREILQTTKLYNSFTSRDHPCVDNRCKGSTLENRFVGFTLKDAPVEPTDCALD
jgi:phage/plasmid-associated DNA primase